MLPTVILLSTYNGEQYLAEQLESILGQSTGRWTLVIRDDGSEDTTPAIIEDYCAQHPQICRLDDEFGGRVGPARSFEKLISFAAGI